MYTDAHIHLYDFFSRSGIEPSPGEDLIFCASAHQEDEFLWQESFARRYPGSVFLSFGIHPQNPNALALPFLEKLVAEGRVSAIGECGFDLYSTEYRSLAEEQRRVWDVQVDLAISSRLPLIVHCRKALHLLFADSRRLARVRCVVFHGWPGSLREAFSLLDRGIEAYFCAGKALLRGDRSLKETISDVPVSRILTETDAPWMRSKGEDWSSPGDIRDVAALAAEIVGISTGSFVSQVLENFKMVFKVCP